MAYKKKGKKSGRRPRKSGAKQQGGRRLTGSGSLRGRPASKPYTSPSPYYPSRETVRRMNWKIKQRSAMRIETSDNIVTLPAWKRGVQKRLSFNEKVQRITQPPTIFKRNYEWSAECNSGRKGFFGFLINDLITGKAGGGGLFEDIMTSNITRLSTDTNVADPTIVANSIYSTQQKFYVDYLCEKLCMVNSGTNSVTGKIRLISYKRDCDNNFINTSVPMQPINLAMYASANGGNVTLNGGTEGTLGNYSFDNATAGVNYTANYIMPGSAQNSGGATMNADLNFDIFGRQIKPFMDFFFKQEEVLSFSLKPGQQINHHTIFNDMNTIHRASGEYTYVRGVSYAVVVEFEAGIVGSSVANNTISTGTGQLSCMLTEKRILGLTQTIKTKLVMPTTAPAGIAIANQQTINPDTGIVDIGYEDDA